MKLSILLVLVICSGSTGWGYTISSFAPSISSCLLTWLAANCTSVLIAKIWIVPLSELHAKYLETGSNEMQNTSAESLPLLNSYSYTPVSVFQILIKVPYNKWVVFLNLPYLRQLLRYFPQHLKSLLLVMTNEHWSWLF